MLQSNEITAETLVTEISRNLSKKVDDFIKVNLSNATPKIKGEITAAKLKWRGVKLIQVSKYPLIEIWIEQRGLSISEKFIINYSIT